MNIVEKAVSVKNIILTSDRCNKNLKFSYKQIWNNRLNIHS